ncbi:TRADD-N-associated membrane domain-containing protein [Streptomyces orinoci]|uniref:Cyanobacterial TRADD-N associated 2 transmembrane domain-containing protein n=1 Tax=Streptomyces orinoci TaxID=67339 RepID=A0ABV3JPR9_STRON|nr:hypothetical protein [Streptomyces orinoci]
MAANRIHGGDEDERPDAGGEAKNEYGISGASYGAVVHGETVTVNQQFLPPAPFNPSGEPEPSLAGQRQKLFFDFIRQALRQADATFRLSVIFMSCGAAIVLVGGGLALVHAGAPNHGYVSVMTSLIGALITTGGGALAVHSNRARKHLTEQAKRLDVQIEEDHKLENARAVIDRVEDRALRDRLNAMTAMRALGVNPDPGQLANRVLPDGGAHGGELGPGRGAAADGPSAEGGEGSSEA